MQFQGFLDDIEYLDSFQFGLGLETELIALIDYLGRDTDRERASPLALLDLLVAFDIIYCGILL